MTRTWTTHDFNAWRRWELIVFSKVGRRKAYLTKRFCGEALSASMLFMPFCSGHEIDASRAKRIQRGSSDALMARSVSLFSLSRFYQHWGPGCADYHDVQSHGGKAPMAIQGSLRQDYGLLPHAAWSRGTP